MYLKKSHKTIFLTLTATLFFSTALICAETQRTPQDSAQKLRQSTKRVLTSTIGLGLLGVSTAAFNGAFNLSAIAQAYTSVASFLVGTSLCGIVATTEYPTTTEDEQDIEFMNDWSRCCSVVGLLTSGALAYTFLKNYAAYFPSAQAAKTATTVAQASAEKTMCTATIDFWLSDEFVARLARAQAQAKPALDITPLLIG